MPKTLERRPSSIAITNTSECWEQFLDRLVELPEQVEFVPFDVARQCGAVDPGRLVDRARGLRLIRWVRNAVKQSAVYVKS